MNHDCNGDRYSVGGEQFYRCLGNGRVVPGNHPNGTTCPECRRTIDTTLSFGELTTRLVVEVEHPEFGWLAHPGPAVSDGEVAYRIRNEELVDEACAAAGLNPGDFDDSERWAAVLEAIRARRAASEVIGYVVVDSEGTIVSLSAREDVAAAHRDRLIMAGAHVAPFRVVSVGPVSEVKPYGWGVINAEAEPMIHLTESAQRFAEESVRKFSGDAGSPYRAVQLFYASPSDRAPEVPEPAPSRADGAAECPERPHRIAAISRSSARMGCRDCGEILSPEEFRGECPGPRPFWGSAAAK